MSKQTRDDNSKRFQPKYTDSDFLETVEQLDLPTAKDVADEIGCVKSTAADRLGALEKESEVTSKEVGQAKVWRRN